MLESPATILFLASDIAEQARLSLGEEAQLIADELQRGRYRGSLCLKDFARALNDGPAIVHFAGHGVGTQGVLFADDQQGTSPVDGDVLRRLLERSAGPLRLVVLNACFSDEQCQAIVSVAGCAIGMMAPIKDEVARCFSQTFYAALAGGRSVRDSFENALTLLEQGAKIGKFSFDGAARDLMSDGSGEGSELSKLVVLRHRGDVDPATIRFAPKVIRYALVFNGKVSDVDAATLTRLIEALREISGDLSLEIESIKDGSIRIVVVTTSTGLERLEHHCKPGVEIVGLTLQRSERDVAPASAPRASSALATATEHMVAYASEAAADPTHDMALLDRWRAGDTTAGQTLFTRHFDSLHRFFRRKADSDIDDLIQETFLRCVKGREQFARHSSFQGYLLAVARRTLYDHLRRRTGPIDIDIEKVSLSSLNPRADVLLEQDRDRATLLRAMRDLELEQQLLLEMFYWEDMSSQQLAEVFEVAEATIRHRLFRARMSLRQALESAAPTVAADIAGELDAWARAVGGKRTRGS